MSSIEVKVSNLVSVLAKAYSFSDEEAMRDHVDMSVFTKTPKAAKAPKEKSVSPPKTPKAPKAPKEKSVSPNSSDKLRHEIELWSKKLESGKMADDKKPALIEKIEKAKAKLLKLETPAPAPVVAAETPVKEKKVAEPKSDKRISRLSPVISKQLASELEVVKVEMTKKLGEDFKKYVEDLAEDDWLSKPLRDHMTDFAKLQAPVIVAPAVETTPKKVSRAKSPKEAKAPKAPKAPKRAQDEKWPDVIEEKKESCLNLTITPTPENSSEIEEISLEDLQNIRVISTIGVGIYWDADLGRKVTGPKQDKDEDLEETTFKDVEYAFGEKTGRIYQEVDGKDQFRGYINVGEFKLW